MALLVTLEWSTDQHQTGEAATLSFFVSGATSRAQASAAVPFQKGATHPEDATIFAAQPVAQRLGTEDSGNFRVHVNFSRDTGGGGGENEPPPDLNNQIPRISWSRAAFLEPTDLSFSVDNNGQAKFIRNAAGDRYNPSPVRRFASRTFTVKKWFGQYPISAADEFEECVNANDWAVSGSSITFLAGTIMCISIMPTQEYAANAPLVEVAFTFERRRRLASPEPFQFSVINQGRHGWYQDGSTKRYGPITTKKGGEYTEVTEDVPLKDDGTPIDASLFIADGKAPIANPVSVTPDHAFNAADGNTRIHVWRTARRISFAGLSSFI